MKSNFKTFPTRFPQQHQSWYLLRRAIHIALWVIGSHLVTSFALPSNARAADASTEYVLREWHVDAGLPDEVVRVVTQDSRGYIWVVTDSGVARFNGIRFDVVAAPGDLNRNGESRARGIPTIISHPSLGVLFAYSNGEIWSWNGAELVPAAMNGVFSNKRITAWFVQKNGTLWADFPEGDIEIYRRGKIVRVALDAAPFSGRPRMFADDGNGGVWIAAQGALYHWTEDALKAESTTSVSLKAIPTNFNGSEICLVSSHDGLPWIIAGDVAGRWSGSRIEHPVQVQRLQSSHYVQSMAEDRSGNLWVATRSQGAYCVNNENGKSVVRAPSSQATISWVCADSEGNVWLATYGGGLNRLQEKRFRLYDSNSGLGDDMTFSVCEDRDGVMWFANRDGGMARVIGGTVQSNPQGWPSNSAGRVYPAQDGGVWFTAGSSLLKSNQDGGGFSRVEGTPIKNIRTIFVSARNELWLGGDVGEVARHDGNRFISVGHDVSLSNQRVSYFAEDSQHRIIMGTNRGSLLRLTRDENGGAKIESLRAAGAQPLPPVRALLIDDDGTVWAGTGGGIYLIKEGRECLIDKSSGLPDQSISQMLFDDSGRVWVGSQRGIFSIERREIADFISGRTKGVRASAFGKNEGLEHISCLSGYQPQCWKGRDGTLWFATRQGVLAIDPQILRMQNQLPPVYIDAVRVDGQTAPMKAQDGASKDASVEIKSDASRVEVLFSALNFVAPERTPVRYKLDGFESDWQTAGGAQTVVYPRLAPGQYRLRVEAAADQENWSEANNGSGASLVIVVVPYWWQTWWFRILAIVVVAVLFASAVRVWSYRRLQRRLAASEREASINRERTRIARDIHDELGASLTQITMLSQLAKVDAKREVSRNCDGPAPRNYYDDIYNTSSSVTRSINEIVWALDAELDNLDSMVSYFGSYAQSFLKTAQISYRFAGPNVLPPLNVSSRVRHDLFLAFKEALNNCAKYSGATEVTFSVSLDANTLTLIVADNGRGLGKTATGENPITQGGGRGLHNFVARMSGIGGKAYVRDGQNCGTEVVFTLPLNKIAL